MAVLFLSGAYDAHAAGAGCLPFVCYHVPEKDRKEMEDGGPEAAA